MSVWPWNPSSQLGSPASGLEYQVTRKREPPSGATPAYEVSPALGSSPHSRIESGPPSKFPRISYRAVRLRVVGPLDVLAGDHEQPLGPGQALGQHARLRSICEQRTHRVRERGEVGRRERRGAERGGDGGDG